MTLSAAADRFGNLPASCDIAIIGAGVVGSAIARELSALDLTVTLLDARNDVGDGTSKANTAILHTGFDTTPGTLESELVQRGYHLLGEHASRVGIPVQRTGALLVAWNDQELAALPDLQAKAAANHRPECRIVDAAEVYHQVPNLGQGALGGLTVPGESLICTWTTTLALATEAILRGTSLCLDTTVLGATPRAGGTVVHTDRGDTTATWVVNAAGLGSDTIDGYFGFKRFTITPRRGELLVYDKLARHLVDRIVLPVPTALGKGVLVSPTIYGNVMLGPTAEDLEDRLDTATSEAGFEFLLSKGARIMPSLLDEEVTASYAGLRAASEHKDYVLDVDPERRYAVAGGIRSTGLTASMAIAEYLRQRMVEHGLDAPPRPSVPPPPQMPNLGEQSDRPYRSPELIAGDPEYGTIVCFCERVTAGEVRDAMTSVIPPASLDGLRRRTRATNGRCQGFYCGAEIRRRFDQLDRRRP